MHELVSYTDYLVLCTGRNTRLTRRISEEVGFRLKEKSGLIPAGVEGASSGEWILMDYLDFVVHIFTPEARDFYRSGRALETGPKRVCGMMGPTRRRALRRLH